MCEISSTLANATTAISSNELLKSQTSMPLFFTRRKTFLLAKDNHTPDFGKHRLIKCYVSTVGDYRKENFPALIKNDIRIEK